MHIADAQQEVRQVYRRGSIGQIVSGAVWGASAALATWGTPQAAILVLVVGGMFIFPVLTLVLRLLGGPATLRRENALAGLAMQVAFVLPLSMPLVAPITAHRLEWFYPSMMILVGAHYAPFVFLYGMWSFAVLAALLVAGGVGLALQGAPFALGGWITGTALAVFGVWQEILMRRRVRPPG